MRKKVILSLTSAIFAFSGLLQAAPSIYAKKLSEKIIKNTSNANIIFDNENETRVWVMPPNTGASEVSGLHPMTANTGFCQEMSDLQKMSKGIVERVYQASEDQFLAQKNIDDLMLKLDQARIEAESLRVSPIVKQLQAANDRIDDIEVRLDTLSSKLEDCTQGCEEIKAERVQLRREKADLTQSRRKLTADNTSELRAYEKKLGVVSAMETNILNKEEAWKKIEVRLLNLRTTFQNMYGSLGKLQGGFANFQYNTNWEEQMNKLRTDNPTFEFMQIPTKNVSITTNIIGANSFPSAGAIMRYAVAGGPSTEGVIKLSSFPGAFSTNIELSLLGACPILNPVAFGFPANKSGDLNSYKMKYGLTAAYEYATAYDLSATVSYNIHRVYEKILSSGTKGGFFRSKSWSKIEDKFTYNDEFKIVWNEEESEHTLSEDEKRARETDMRNSIFARLVSVGLPAAANAGALVLTAPPKNGAVVISESLMQTCPQNIYCVGASIGMNVLDAIFGNSSSIAEFKNTQDVDLIEVWSSKKMLYRPYVTSYN